MSEETDWSLVPSDQPTDQKRMAKISGDPMANPTTALARVLLSLTRNSLQRFHQEHTDKLDMILNQERWHAVSVPNRVQDLVTCAFTNALRNGTKVCLFLIAVVLSFLFGFCSVTCATLFCVIPFRNLVFSTQVQTVLSDF